MATPRLTRFWIEFERLHETELPLGVQFGVGVTAIDRADVLRLVEEALFEDAAMPPIKRLRENVDISTLDAGHVIPNMEPPTSRGIWFPRGYA